MGGFLRNGENKFERIKLIGTPSKVNRRTKDVKLGLGLGVFVAFFFN